MSATLNSRFTLTDDPDEIIRRLHEQGVLDPALLPPERRAAFEAAEDRCREGKTGRHGEGETRRHGERETPAASCAGRGSPDPAVGNGRAANGQFVKGNRGGPGNPYNRQIAEFRKQFLAVSTPEI